MEKKLILVTIALKWEEEHGFGKTFLKPTFLESISAPFVPTPPNQISRLTVC